MEKDLVKKVSGYIDYRAFLSDFYQEKKEGARGFTYKKWAKDLGIRSPSALLMIVNGQRHPGPKLTFKLTRYLGLNDVEAAYFSDLVQLQKSGGAQLPSRARNIPAKYGVLENDKFRLIAQWYGYAIRELVYLADFSPDVGWMKSRLLAKVSKREVRDTVNNLLALGLWTRDRWRGFKAGFGVIRTSDDVKSAALRHYHDQILQLARESLQTVDPSLREISGGCFVVDPARLQDIKEDIRHFQHQLCEKYGKDQGSEVYQIETCFFPLTTSKSVSKQPQETELH